jgi:hypothetical protein
MRFASSGAGKSGAEPAIKRMAAKVTVFISSKPFIVEVAVTSTTNGSARKGQPPDYFDRFNDWSWANGGL